MRVHNVETIHCATEADWLALRAHNLNSTEMAALFGASLHTTEFELYHRHVNNISTPFVENDRSKWGKRLQDSIAFGVAEDQGWKVRRMSEYMQIRELRLGSSFDFDVEEVEDKEALLEVKNVDSLQFRDGWLIDEDGSIEAPLHFEIQVQHQMAISRRKLCYLAALVGGNRIVLVERKADEEVISKIFEKAREFWQRVDNKQEPSPNFVRDSAFISRLYSQAEPGKILDASSNTGIATLAKDYAYWQKQEKDAKLEKDAVKAQLLMEINDCEKVIGSNFSISAGVVAGASISYEREPYRNFRVNFKKEKA